MFEFEGAFEGLEMASGAEVSVMDALGLLGGVVDIVSEVACEVGDASWDERLGKSDGGGYF
jgi:hypothetical protein